MLICSWGGEKKFITCEHLGQGLMGNELRSKTSLEGNRRRGNVKRKRKTEGFWRVYAILEDVFRQ